MIATSIILGIYPGAHGAIAVLNESGDLLEVVDIPSLRRRTAGVRPTRHCWRDTLARAGACGLLRIRRRASYRREGCGVCFRDSRGVIDGCVGALGLPIVFLTPPTWKRLADIPPGAENKDPARTRAIARWPGRADLFARKCDVDRAEAALIASAGLARETRRG